MLPSGDEAPRLFGLPIASSIVSAEGAVELQYFGPLPSLEAGAVVPLERTRGCAPHALPPPIASFRVSAEGPIEEIEASAGLAAPTLACATSSTLAIVAAAGPSPCSRSEGTLRDCGVDLDLQYCLSAPPSRWGLRLDGSSCGPVAGDAQCAPDGVDGGDCAGARFEGVPLKTLELDVRRVTLEPPSRPIALRLTGDGAWVSSVPRGSSNPCAFADLGRAPPPTRLSLLSLDGLQVVASATVPPCLVALEPAAEGGVWGAYAPPRWPRELGVARLDRALRIVQSATVATPPELLPPEHQLHFVSGVHDVGGELIVSLSAEVPGGADGDRAAFFVFDRRLAHRRTLVTRARLRDARVDGERLVVSDDKGNSVRFFPLPLTEPLTASLELGSPDFNIEMGPILLALDEELVLLGTQAARAGVTRFFRLDARSAVRAVFAARPYSRVAALLRLDARRGLAITTAVPPPGDEASEAVLLARFELPTGSRPFRVGDETAKIGEGFVVGAEMHEGRAWVALGPAGELLSIGVP